MVVRECVLYCKLDFIRQARQFFHACDKCLLEGLCPLVGQPVGAGSTNRPASCGDLNPPGTLGILALPVAKMYNSCDGS